MPERKISDTFRVQEVVIEIDGKYPQKVLFQLTNDDIEKFGLTEGMTIYDIQYNLRGRVWASPEGVDRYFTTLQIWSLSENPPKVEMDGINKNFQEDAIQTSTDELDDMPF